MSTIRMLLVLAFLSALACSHDKPPSPVVDETQSPYGLGDNTFPVQYPVSLETAIVAAEVAGLNRADLTYTDLIPVDFDSNGEFETVWALATTRSLVYYIDPWTGATTRVGEATDGLADVLTQRESSGVPKAPAGRTPGTYESFPWGANLPFFGSMSVSCGYGCGVHKASILNSLDWNLAGTKDDGNPVVAPISGFVMDNRYNGGYGWQIIIKGKSDGLGGNFVWRGAHLKTKSPMVPGWWVWQGLQVGQIGTTGTNSDGTPSSTGPHLHSEMWRGTVSGGSISGGTVPWSRWPGPGDNVDGYDGSTGRCFQSGNVGSSGDACP